MSAIKESLNADSNFIISDVTDSTKELKFDVSGITTATTRTWTVPDVTTTFVGIDNTQTLTNKTINTASNTLTIATADVTSGTFANARIAVGNVTQHEGSITIGNLIGAPTGTVVGTTDTQTLTNKTLTLPQINDTSADHQYIFGVSELTTDRTVTLPLLTGNDTFVFEAFAQTLTNKTVDADNNTLSNIDNADIKAAAAIDATKIADGSVSNTEFQYLNALTSAAVGLTDTQTLTNKTLTSPVLTTPEINDTSADHQYIYGVSELTADRTITLPLLTGNDTFVFEAHTQTLTNKTINTASNTLTVDAGDITTGTLPVGRGGSGATTLTQDGWLRGNGTGAITSIKNNLSGSAAPATTDDSGSGYAVGSRWLDTTNNEEYICLDATTSAAVWRNTSAADEYDAVVDADGNADYTSIVSAFGAGHKAVFVRNGSYTETADIDIPSGGALVGESMNDVVITMSGAYSIKCDGSGGTKETAGTISITNNTTAVTGSGTTFTNLNPLSSTFIIIEQNAYPVSSVTDNTNLTIGLAFKGKTVSGRPYIAQQMNSSIIINNITVTGSSSPGVYLRAVRHAVVTDVVSRANAGGAYIYECVNTNVTSLMSQNSSAIGFDIGNTNSCVLDNCQAFNSTGNGINVSGTAKNIIISSTQGSNGLTTGLNVTNTATNLTVSQCIFNNNVSKGINTDSGTGTATFDGCCLRMNGSDGIDIDGSNNIVAACMIGENGGHGVQCGDLAVVTNNQIFDNTSNGVNMTVDNDCSVVGNQIYGNSVGVYLDDVRNTISGNIIRDNSSHGIQGTSTANNNVFNSNIIKGNGGDGVNLAGGNCIIVGNEIISNTGNGIETTVAATGTLIHSNVIDGNTAGDLNIAGTLAQVTADDIDTITATTLLLGKSIATKVEIADTGVITEIQGNLDALEGLDVTGNITVTGTVDGVDIASHDTATTGVHGISGNIVGTTDTQTLSNKTLTAPQINDTSADHQYIFGVSELTLDRTITLPLLTGNDTFVFEAFTQTLTNKTINADNNTLSNIDNADIKAAAAIDATKIANGSVTNTEFQYINTVTSNVQTQINTKTTGPGTVMDQELTRYNGTAGYTVEGVGIRHYGKSASDPVSPAPQDGDKYYNTEINHEMCYDGSRSKWLSVAILMDGAGRNGTTTASSYYRRWNGMILAAAQGPHVPKGTIIRIGYSTSVAVTHTYEVLVGGVVKASLASGGAASASSDTINADFDAGIMSSRSAGGSATTTNFQSVIFYKLRA